MPVPAVIGGLLCPVEQEWMGWEAKRKLYGNFSWEFNQMPGHSCRLRNSNFIYLLFANTQSQWIVHPSRVVINSPFVEWTMQSICIQIVYIYSVKMMKFFSIVFSFSRCTISILSTNHTHRTEVKFLSLLSNSNTQKMNSCPTANRFSTIKV